MSTIVITERISATSPLFQARMGGACWLMCFVTSIFPLIVGDRLVLPNDASRTGSNILANETLFRSGTAAILISTAFYVAATLVVGVNVQRWNKQASAAVSLGV